MKNKKFTHIVADDLAQYTMKVYCNDEPLEEDEIFNICIRLVTILLNKNGCKNE